MKGNSSKSNYKKCAVFNSFLRNSESIRKSPWNPHRPMGIHHSPHTHPTPIPMGIPIPTAALEVTESLYFDGNVSSVTRNNQLFLATGQFLTGCKIIASYRKVGHEATPDNMKSYVPKGMYGSCGGSQSGTGSP